MSADAGVIRRRRYDDVEKLEVENKSYSRGNFIKILTRKKDKQIR